MARSKVADELRAEDEAYVRSLTAEQRVALARELGERGIRMYMDAHGVDRETALRELRKLKRNGRPRSRCMEQS
jgi:hypothetical protein